MPKIAKINRDFENRKVNMKAYSILTSEERAAEYKACLEEYKTYCKMSLKLDLSRGKPNSSQLDVSAGLLAVDMTGRAAYSAAGFDCRNYGILDGIPEMKRFFADAFGIAEEDIIVGGNSSLQLMYGALSRAMTFGVYGSERPWAKEEGLKWICITPGYDRHFRITELMGK